MAPPLRILCFGASITGGWYRGGLSLHPYALRLKSRLEAKLAPFSGSGGSGCPVEIDIDASPGAAVMGNDYNFRLRARQNRGVKYDWVIVQGGGNDLLQGSAPEMVFEQLRKMWRSVIEMGVGGKVLALTVTETADRRPQVRALYDTLNGMVVGQQEKGVEVADVAGKIPWPIDTEEKEKIWDDGLHFTPLGYDMLGDAIAEHLLDLEEGALRAKI